MDEALRSSVPAEVVETAVPGVSWAAVAAGAAASLALTLVLLSFGAGMGFAVVSPWGNSGVSATTFKIGTGLFFIVMAMLSSSIGGYLAGRLRTKWVGVHATEVQFRDTAHGFLAWAVASVLGAVLLASPAGSLIGGALGSAAPAAASVASSGPMEGYVDALLRPSDPSAQGQNTSDPRAEMMRLLTTDFRTGNDLNPTDRSYVAKVVAMRTGLSQADAEKAGERRRDASEDGPRQCPQGGDADGDLVDAIAVHRCILCNQHKAQEGRDLRNEGRIEDGKDPKTTKPGTGHPEK